MRLTTLQALDLCLMRLELKARFADKDALRTYFNAQAALLRDEIVSECLRIHARGGAIPTELADCPC